MEMIKITREQKIIMIEALKNGEIHKDKAQILSNSLNQFSPFERMRLNHSLSIEKTETE